MKGRVAFGCRYREDQTSPMAQGQRIHRRRRRQGFDSWFERSSGEGNANPLQYPFQENPMDRGAWWAIVHGVGESDTTEATEHTLLERTQQSALQWL